MQMRQNDVGDLVGPGTGVRDPELDRDDEALHGGHVVMRGEPVRVRGECGMILAGEEEVGRMGWAGIFEHADDACSAGGTGLHDHRGSTNACMGGGARGMAVSSLGSVARTEARAAKPACQRASAGQRSRQLSAAKRKSR